MHHDERENILTTPYPVHTLELEVENARLQRLIADLLVKNQQLRAEVQSLLRANNQARSC